MHAIEIITSHPKATAEARKLVLNDINDHRVTLVTSPALERRGRAQVHVDAEGAILRDVVDALDRAGFL